MVQLAGSAFSLVAHRLQLSVRIDHPTLRLGIINANHGCRWQHVNPNTRILAWFAAANLAGTGWRGVRLTVQFDFSIAIHP